MSISEAQSAANKANAAHSTGPKTQNGKSRSSKNRKRQSNRIYE
jgi:hypothetical protein